jgi:hypothetical protein
MSGAGHALNRCAEPSEQEGTTVTLNLQLRVNWPLRGGDC